jgi:hypothetical protein
VGLDQEESIMKTFIGAAAFVLLSACHEIPQDAPKPFAGKSETEPYAAAPFNGDKAAYEKAMAKRVEYQNEYLRVPK